MITTIDLCKIYKKKKAVNRVSFHVNKGEAFALLGSNGAGKTTTIKMILGLVKADNGEIILDERIKTGYSPETPYFHPYLTGKEVLEFYGRLQRYKKKELRETIPEIMEKVGLRDASVEDINVKNYSKGMLQRLAFAQALLGNPKLLILDEPCAGLDPIGRIEIIDIINKLKVTGRTIIMNSHILSDIEKVCDHGVIMENGKILRKWKIDEITDKYTLEDMFVEVVGGGSRDYHN